METVPAHIGNDRNILKSAWLDTPLEPMLAVSDEEKLYLLEFASQRRLEHRMERLRIRTRSTIISGSTQPLTSITTEIKAYFEGNLKEFKTPLHLLGTPFQELVWEHLIQIPYGTTQSYVNQAIKIGNRSAYRAVANANGSNQIAIVIPCHRVINNNGDIGGYGGGVAHKKWLLDFERR